SMSIKALQKIAWGLGVSPSVLMESKHTPAESEEKIMNEVQELISNLPYDRLKIIRDLLNVFPEQQGPSFPHERFSVIERRKR
ncbi:MAG: hypothetical protein M1543_02855, partial [Firmicutes bacterium]|nr:hypothetical protein [Bacillota bacterium]